MNRSEALRAHGLADRVVASVNKIEASERAEDAAGVYAALLGCALAGLRAQGVSAATCGMMATHSLLAIDRERGAAS